MDDRAPGFLAEKRIGDVLSPIFMADRK